MKAVYLFIIATLVLYGGQLQASNKKEALFGAQYLDMLHGQLCPTDSFEKCSRKIAEWVAVSYMDANSEQYRDAIVQRVYEAKRKESNFTSSQLDEWKERLRSGSTSQQQVLYDSYRVQKNKLLWEISKFWMKTGSLPPVDNQFLEAL